MSIALGWIVAVYAAMSVITYVAYARDKSAARRHARRIPEATLHLLGLAFGWPGALIAQRHLRHKTRKTRFLAIFWGTVVLNLAALAGVLWLTARWFA